MIGCLFEGYDFGVVAVVVEVSAFANDPGRVTVGGRLGKDTAYLGVRGGETDSLGGEVEHSLHEDFVLGGVCVSRHLSQG